MTEQPRTKQNKTALRRFNEGVMKLAWTYIIAISLILVLVVQWYTSSMEVSRSNKTVLPFEEKIESLQQKVDELESRIKELENKQP